MKKSLSTMICLLLSLTLILSACGGGSSSEGSDKSSGQTTEQPAEELVTDGLIKASDASLSPELAKNRKDTMIIGITAPSGIFNPLYGETAYDNFINTTIFTSMIEVNKDGTYKEGIVEKWEISPDNLVYTFTLRDGLKFSDNTPLTADDVAFSLTVLHDKSYDGPSDIIKDAHIKGGKEYKEGKATSIEGIKVLDPRTIQVTTTEVNALAFSSIGSVGVLPKAIYGKDYKQGNLGYMRDLFTIPVGNGPYKLEKFTPGQEAVLVANELFYQGKPKIEKLIYKFTTPETNVQLMQAGETDMDFIDVNKDTIEQLKEFGFVDVNLFPANSYGYIAFNHKHDQFKDKRVRQALTYGLNRKEIVDAVYQGYADVLNVPQSKVSWAYTDDVNKYDFDMEKAKQLLDEAGWKVGGDGIREKDGKKFKITFTATTPNPVNDAIIPLAQASYKELGIEFVAEQMDFNAAVDKRKKGDFDMMFLAWGLTPDPQSGENVFKSGGSQNDVGYSNPKVDELFTKAGAMVDTEKRKEVFKELYKELNEDLPYIFLYQRRDMWANNARLQGFDMSPYRNFTYSLPQLQIQ
ncbi:ABC-type dipeptide/oligopeptide/nickel transport system, periplasmic component [Paenibacillus alvei TS-15]|uniref:ABC-type dipeptide/oligopeptide/nickel transport system, periplasmic component n=1 Tax=Paenibacillus alvei TS-15 TaxID=1117108 RepID=S9U6Q0_PAEAL|nr:ABC transporter substrate-binding protein [Paenibacillus alvei]EPY06130.1 ABC-type dipeptide/oligopeptide/nickel transport system, periplasmic component [Paenibacillus alvei TS-15]